MWKPPLGLLTLFTLGAALRTRERTLWSSAKCFLRAQSQAIIASRVASGSARRNFTGFGHGAPSPANQTNTKPRQSRRAGSGRPPFATRAGGMVASLRIFPIAAGRRPHSQSGAVSPDWRPSIGSMAGLCKEMSSGQSIRECRSLWARGL